MDLPVKSEFRSIYNLLNFAIMNKIYINLFVLAILLLSVQVVKAQVQGYVSIPEPKRIVEIPGVLVDASGNYDYDDYENATDAIYRAIKEDVESGDRTLGDGTVYVLKRNHVYISTSMIYHEFMDIHIKGEEGEGRMPLVLHNKINDQNVAFIRAFQNTILEGFEYDAKNPDNTFGNRTIDFRGANSRVIVKGCRFSNDRAGALTIEGTGDGMKLYVYDCVMGNQGHYISLGGNGRALDIRVNNETGYLDTVVFKNNTIYNLTDRVVRSMGGIVTYMEFDHNTIINNEGVHGCIQLGNTKEAVITNNVFANPMVFGNRLATNLRGEQTQQTQTDHADKAFAIVTHNGTVGRLEQADIKGVTMRNNNIFFKQEFLDLFAANPTMFTPTVRTASDAVYANLTGDPANMSFTEELAFDYNDTQAGNLGTVSSYKDMVAVTEAFIADPARSSLPENWSLIYPYEWNAVYPTDTRSYTAADGGYPVGDLNWFPADKEKWLTSPTKTAAAVKTAEVPVGIEINKVYPNPFVSQITVNYTLLSGQRIDISIYNLMGQKIRTIQNGYIPQGTYEVIWDGKGNNGNAQTGIYYLIISGDRERVSAKVVKN